MKTANPSFSSSRFRARKANRANTIARDSANFIYQYTDHWSLQTPLFN
jgi:hypothetical protein